MNLIKPFYRRLPIENNKSKIQTIIYKNVIEFLSNCRLPLFWENVLISLLMSVLIALAFVHYLAHRNPYYVTYRIMFFKTKKDIIPLSLNISLNPMKRMTS